MISSLKKILKIILIIISAICVIAFLIGFFLGDGRHNEAAGGNAQIADSGKENLKSLVVSAHKLFADYHANEVSADAKYKNKQIELTGIVQSINKDFTNSIVIDFEVGDGFSSVHASMNDSEAQKAASLSKGGKITVVCEGDGMVLGDPNIKDCIIKAP